MHSINAIMIENKNELIARYLMPALNLITQNRGELLAALCWVCKLQSTVKYQLLEAPGSHEEGQLWFAIDAMVHAYHYCPVKKCKWGSRIWKKQEFIVSGPSLLHQQPLTDYIEVLEPGRVLSIGYTDLTGLMARYPELALQLQHIGIENEGYYRHRNWLLTQPAWLRIKQFKAENVLFMRVASHGCVATHIGMALRTYAEYLKRGKEE